jgi:hypothetical protein
VDVTHVHELLEIVRDVGAEIIAPRLELARRQLTVADVVKKKCLYAVEVSATLAVELVLDDVEEQSMKTLHETQCLKILGLERIVAGRCAMTRHIERNTHCFSRLCPV